MHLLVGVDGGGGVNFGSDTWQSPNDVLSVMAGKEFVEVVASFKIVWRTYDGAR